MVATEAIATACGSPPTDQTPAAIAIRSVPFDGSWPKEPVASVTFSGPAGQFTIVLEDGRLTDGIAPPI
jgi:hypothetical protein